jgi:P27 family predicted phage terminase small subunit
MKQRSQRGRKSRAALELSHPQPANDRPHPAFDPPQPPSHLGEPERQIWADVFSDYELESKASIAVLATSLEAHMRARLAREAIAREGMTTTGRDDQVKAHPLLAVERDARQAWLAGIKTLGLEL